MSRRPGEGSIYRRADGRLAVELSVGPRGARQRFGPLYATDDDDAVAKLELLRRQAGVLGPADPAVQTVGQWLRWWVDVELLGRVEEGTFAATTLAGYEAKVRLYLIPHLGHIKLRQLTPQHVRGFMRTLASTPARGGQPLSARSREYIHAILRAALACAKQCQQVDINAAELVSAPTVVRTKPPALSPDNADLMLEVIEGDRLEALWLAALSVGLRPGEALGLCWPAVDLDAGEMVVCSNLVRIDGQVRMHDTKSHRARTVPLPEPAVEVLRRHRQQQRKERLAAGPEWVGTVVHDPTGRKRVDVDLVFTDTRGRPLRQDWLEDELVRLCKRAGVAEMTPHKFIRHGGATLMLAMGVDLYTLRDILGHSSVQVTEIYAHVLDEAKRDAANRMGQMLNRRRRNGGVTGT